MSLYYHSHRPMLPTDAELATKALDEETAYRFPSFSANDAVTLGLSLRKRFRSSSRHQRLGRGLIISIQTIVGHTLFSCTVGDLGTTVGDVSLDSWTSLDGMIAVVRRTGHSSFYVEKGMGAMGKTPKQLGLPPDLRIHGGGEPLVHCCHPCFGKKMASELTFQRIAFPIWLQASVGSKKISYE
jgi:uncharacterized protein (UPF0303 family)